MSEDFTLYRGATGTPHVTEFRCPHRGTQLSSGWVEGDAIRCFYHGWKYDAAGQCVEQPPEPQSFANKIRIASYPAVEYLGFIFAYLGEGDPPEFPRFPELEADGDSILDWDSYVRNCNYFQNMENAFDNAHVGFVHRDIDVAFDGLVDRPVIAAAENEWGIVRTVERSSGSERQTFFGMPNMYYMFAFPRDPKLTWTKSLFFWVPIDDEHHISYIVRRLPLSGDAAREYSERKAARKEARDLRHTDMAKLVLTGQIQREAVDSTRIDLPRFQDEVAQVGQGAIADREHERLGHSDVGIILLRKIWNRELRAFDEGKPLTQWHRPAGMTPPPPHEAPRVLADTL